MEAENAHGALEIFQARNDLALLFTDVVLPGGISGADLAQEVRGQRPDLPILMTSGYTEHPVLGRVQLDLSLDLIQKPVTKTELARKIRDALEAAPPPTLRADS